MKQHTPLRKTRRIFDEDAYIKEFEGNVISCERLDNGRYSVVLDKTAFFPEGGGQPSDVGTLRGASDVKVLDVQEKNGEIFHITDEPVETGAVTGIIDWDLRYERMRGHSGEHLLSGFAHRLFGCTNVGFHLSDESITVDFDKQLSAEQLLMIESAVNDVIAENVRIKAIYPDPKELACLDYRSKLELTENVRIVEIGEDGKYDRCACCAPHVASTAEIGMLIVTDSINYKGGTRLTMVCGKNAYRISRMAVTNVHGICGLLSAKFGEASQAVADLIRRNEDEKVRYSKLCSSYIDLRISQMTGTEDNVILFEPQLDRNALRRLVDKAANLCTGCCAGFTGSDENSWTYIIISRTWDLKAELRSLNDKMNGRGGGSAQMIQGTAHAPRSVLEKIFD